jgi:DNA-binding LytR/AlgR family response regulator
VSLVDDTLLTRSSLNRLESLLSTERFVRIHRSTIVNLDQICHLEPQAGGEYIVTLNCGKQLKASRRHVCDLMRSIRGKTSAESLLPESKQVNRTVNIGPQPVERMAART